MRKKIVITGGAGNIGRKLWGPLGESFDCLFLDREPGTEAGILRADLSRFDPQWSRHFTGASCVIHLAGNPDAAATWDELYADNVDAVLNVCRACRETGVERLIFASSCHTMEGYFDRGLKRITAAMRPYPTTSYGLSKVIGEGICRGFSDRHSLSVICLRIGWVLDFEELRTIPHVPWLESLWLSRTDLVQVMEKAIQLKNIRFSILYAMSNNRNMIWDLQQTIDTLGYRPRDGLRNGRRLMSLLQRSVTSGRRHSPVHHD
jgi:NAD+ dependent glucose-6-phosphate dehydrogenase